MLSTPSAPPHPARKKKGEPCISDMRLLLAAAERGANPSAIPTPYLQIIEVWI